METNMLLKKLTIVLLINFIFTTPIFAANWSSAGMDSKGVKQYIDLNSVVKKGDVVSYWSLINFTSPQSLPGGLQYLSLKVAKRINCAEKQHTFSNSYAYSETWGDGDVVKTLKTDNPFELIVPESIMDTQYKLVCQIK